MKVTISIDCTPEEARTFFGLPDVSGAQKTVIDEWQRRAMDAMSNMDPQSLIKTWVPEGPALPTDVEGWEQFQNVFWAAIRDSGFKPGK
ncbi:MAG: DUF6489 family protein [Alphaproteobacteria bacterium]|nr:DUF6489 family protein [Alphaproteobacteria bacterium]